MEAQTSITFGYHSDVGLVRGDNQDSFALFPGTDDPPAGAKGRLFVIADGMGGYKGGNVASRLAVETVCNVYAEDSDQRTGEVLRQAFQKANAVIRAERMRDASLAKMGSTCTALVLRDGSAFVAHVGDSRAYRISGSSIRQLTNDHSRVGELQQQGILTKEEARSHPERSFITRALGVEDTVEVDVLRELVLRKDERFLLCTDGVYGNIEEYELRNAAMSMAPENACKALIDLANARGGQDNATAMIIHVQRRLTFFQRLQGIFAYRG